MTYRILDTFPTYLVDENGPIVGAALHVFAFNTLTDVSIYGGPAGGSISNPQLSDADGYIRPVYYDGTVRTRAMIVLPGGSTASPKWEAEDLPMDDAAHMLPDGSNASMTPTDMDNFLTAGSADAGSIEYTPPNAPTSRTVGDKLDESLSMGDFGNFITAIQNYQRPYGTYHIGGPALRFPMQYGDKSLSATIEIKQQYSIIGDSVGYEGGQSSCFMFADDVTGFRIPSHNTTGITTESPDDLGTFSGANTRLSGLSLFGGGTDPAAHGIHARATCDIDHCYIISFPGHGLYSNCTATGGGAVEGNANNMHVGRCTFELCDGWGIYLDGADTNAGLFYGIDCRYNTLGGFFDSSFLGNTWLACHTASNSGPSYKSDNANSRALWLGCYVESGQPDPEIICPNLAIGGFLAEYVAAAGGPGLYAASGVNSILSGIGIGSFDQTGANSVTTLLGGEPAINTIFYIGKSDVALPFRTAWTGVDWAWDYANSSGFQWMKITGPGTTFTGGRASSVGAAMVNFPAGMWLGAGVNARYLGISAGVPASGEAAAGDTWLNINAAAGGKALVRCTTSGTIGSTAVLKSGAVLDA